MYNKRHRKLPVILETEEARKLIRIPQMRYPTGLRNKACLSLMLNMGMRVSEVCNLKPGDISLSKAKLRVIQGKGGVDRDLTIPEGIIELLKKWRESKPKGTKTFFPTLKGKKMQTDYLCKVVKRYGKRAAIKKVISPHTLRHTYATKFYRQENNIEALRQILGHADVSTTQIYITLDNKDVEEAMQKVEVII